MTEKWKDEKLFPSSCVLYTIQKVSRSNDNCAIAFCLLNNQYQDNWLGRFYYISTSDCSFLILSIFFSKFPYCTVNQNIIHYKSASSINSFIHLSIMSNWLSMSKYLPAENFILSIWWKRGSFNVLPTLLLLLMDFRAFRKKMCYSKKNCPVRTFLFCFW